MKSIFKNPYAIAAIAILVLLVILKLPLDILLEKLEWSARHTTYADRIIKNIIVLVLALFVIKKLKLKALSGLHNQFKLQQAYLITIPLYLIIIGIFSLLQQDVLNISIFDIVLLTVAMLSVGFVEEFIFRGIIQSIFLKTFIHHKKGIRFSIFMPAFLFGILHIVNVDLSTIPSTISQIIYAFFIGTTFGVILLKTNKLIPLAIIHGLINTIFSIGSLQNSAPKSQDISAAISSILIVLPLFIIGLILIKKIKKNSIIMKINSDNRDVTKPR